MALAEPQQAGVQSGFIASTIGVTAIVIGRRLVTDRSRFGNVARAFGRGAVMLGTVGTALMAYAVLAFGLSTVGVQWPALSLPGPHEGQVFDAGFPVAESSPEPAPADPATEDQTPAEAVPESAAADDSTQQGAAPAPAEAPAPQAPAVPEPTSFEAERSAVAMGAGTLAYALEGRFEAGTYPTELTTASAPARIALLDGTGLAPIPAGARVLYSVAPDRSAWSVTIIGARFGATASYSSAVGTVQAG
ncbi:hypothetical protein [Curtobacterium caseinilyticum]|uniref:DUF4190 domain-containing protein n=1 Tax=Curtobacterium caseinilyticum TaxID=3055137 RepID=A0ABT7TP93_9MICO|nr:hypothetical protein [Curtobacterium caseinilyticum]MDM7891413.1 hypothetical protein [Curtobacterium caseinilyticum]